MKKYLRHLKRMNVKSIRFNLKYLPFKDAIRLPFLISNNVFCLETNGNIKIEAQIKPGMIKIGFGKVGIFDMNRSRSIWQVSGNVIFKGNAEIGHGTKISVNEGGLLELGRNVKVTAETEIVVQKSIKIGDNVLISWNCLIMDTDFHKIYDQDGKIINSPKPIIIGNKVWIGCRTVILKGSKIADGSVIGTNSFLSKDISNQSGIFAGNPIRFIKGDITWKG